MDYFPVCGRQNTDPGQMEVNIFGNRWHYWQPELISDIYLHVLQRFQVSFKQEAAKGKSHLTFEQVISLQ